MFKISLYDLDFRRLKKHLGV